MFSFIIFSPHLCSSLFLFLFLFLSLFFLPPPDEKQKQKTGRPPLPPGQALQRPRGPRPARPLHPRLGAPHAHRPQHSAGGAPQRRAVLARDDAAAGPDGLEAACGVRRARRRARERDDGRGDARDGAAGRDVGGDADDGRAELRGVRGRGQHEKVRSGRRHRGPQGRLRPERPRHDRAVAPGRAAEARGRRARVRFGRRGPFRRRARRRGGIWPVGRA